MRPSLPASSLLLGAAALLVGAGAPEETPRDIVDVRAVLAGAPITTLHAGDMTVTIALPDAVHGFYRGTRFDWAGMIVEARRQGHRFYGPWFDGIAPNIRDFTDDGHRLIAGPQTAATGPAEEFIDPTPGYTEVPVGGTFLKIGVGRLRKADALRYSRFRSYAIIDNGSWRVRRTAQTVTFRQMIAPDASGYGYIYEKMVRVRSGGRIEIGHRLANIGIRPISTQVYNHNFTRFDDRDIGPGVSIDLPYPLPESTATPHLVSVKGSTLSYLAPLAAGDHVTLSPNGFTPDSHRSRPNLVDTPRSCSGAVHRDPTACWRRKALGLALQSLCEWKTIDRKIIAKIDRDDQQILFLIILIESHTVKDPERNGKQAPYIVTRSMSD